MLRILCAACACPLAPTLGVNILRLFQIAALGLLIPSIASSADSCAARYGLDDDSCLCHEKAQSLSVPTPNGFSLVAACNMTDIKDGRTIPLKSAKGLPAERFDMGIYLYKGRRTLAGKIVKAFDPMADYSVTFFPTEPISKSNALRMSTHPPGHVVMAAWRQSRRKQGGFME